MWSREELKTRAKAVLRHNYWKALLISIIIAIAGGNDSGGGNYHYSSSNSNAHSYIHNNMFSNFHFLLLVAITLITIILVIIFFRIFIGYCLEVGGRKYFIKSAQHENNEKCFRFAFSGENYMGIVKTMLLTNIYIFLWSLLLIIPGIIKSYSYRMVPYILADNPNIGASNAISLSKEMTKGHKFDMFLLDLSFIGWYLLGALAFLIGMLFVMPYENATNAELYLVLRRNALANNLCSYDGLSLTEPILY